jgi:transketolase
MAMAEAHLAARYNRPEHRVVSHRTWALCSDGDLMEGVSCEAASLAGHLGLGRLVWIWDDNRITIEGATDLAFSEDVCGRFEALRWRILRIDDVNNLSAVAAAFDDAVEDDGRPTLIAARSHIAWGAPTKQDTADAHGAPLGEEEVRAAKRAYGLPEDEHFHVPEGVREHCDQADRGLMAEADWVRRLAIWKQQYPELAAELARRLEDRLPDRWEDALPSFAPDPKGMATRAASGKVLNAIAETLPELVGGSADLAPSTKTLMACSGDLGATSAGERNIRFGIREHGMAAILNGMSLHGGIRPFGATFLVFADYMRPAIRLAALMGQSVIYVFTHDSIWVGEDGPTHQPVEQMASLRAIPNLTVIRPADANETAAAWRLAVERNLGPTALILSRQGLSVLEETAARAARGVLRGGYVLKDVEEPELVILATGAEVIVAHGACALLADRGLRARLVSMPSWEVFELQPKAYQREVLPEGVPRLAVEAGATMGWHRWVGEGGDVVGLDRFGASAPGKVVAAKLGFTAEAIADRAVVLVGREE